jgi:hypothetical protein
MLGLLGVGSRFDFAAGRPLSKQTSSKQEYARETRIKFHHTSSLDLAFAGLTDHALGSSEEA